MIARIWLRPPYPHPLSPDRSSVSQDVDTSPKGQGSVPGLDTAGSKTSAAERKRSGGERHEEKCGEEYRLPGLKVSQYKLTGAVTKQKHSDENCNQQSGVFQLLREISGSLAAKQFFNCVGLLFGAEQVVDSGLLEVLETGAF